MIHKSHEPFFNSQQNIENNLNSEYEIISYFMKKYNPILNLMAARLLKQS